MLYVKEATVGDAPTMKRFRPESSRLGQPDS